MLTLSEDTVGPDASPDSEFRPGQYWMIATLFDPAIQSGHPGGGAYNAWNRDQYDWYERQVLGGVWARWDSEEDYLEGEPGVVEYLAAGSGFGPDVVEAAATAMGSFLVLDSKSTWDAQQLFKRYGGMVPPAELRGERWYRPHPFRRVAVDQAMADNRRVVKRVAASAYNRLGVPHLPRYRAEDDPFKMDMAKVLGDQA